MIWPSFCKGRELAFVEKNKLRSRFPFLEYINAVISVQAEGQWNKVSTRLHSVFRPL